MLPPENNLLTDDEVGRYEEEERGEGFELADGEARRDG